MARDYLLKVEALATPPAVQARGGVPIAPLHDIGFTLAAGECLALEDCGSAGARSLLDCIHGDLKVHAGRICVRQASHGFPVDLGAASPEHLLELRRTTITRIGQRLWTDPRRSAREFVAAPLIALGWPRPQALERSDALLARLALPGRLAHCPIGTQPPGGLQRIRIARGFVADKPVLLLDEPLDSLDAAARRTVTDLIHEACRKGRGVVAHLNDVEVMHSVASRRLRIAQPASALVETRLSATEKLHIAVTHLKTGRASISTAPGPSPGVDRFRTPWRST